jgi:hypothetical protein
MQGKGGQAIIKCDALTCVLLLSCLLWPEAIYWLPSIDIQRKGDQALASPQFVALSIKATIKRPGKNLKGCVKSLTLPSTVPSKRPTM